MNEHYKRFGYIIIIHTQDKSSWCQIGLEMLFLLIKLHIQTHQFPNGVMYAEVILLKISMKRKFRMTEIYISLEQKKRLLIGISGTNKWNKESTMKEEYFCLETDSSTK